MKKVDTKKQERSDLNTSILLGVVMVAVVVAVIIFIFIQLSFRRVLI